MIEKIKSALTLVVGFALILTTILMVGGPSLLLAVIGIVVLSLFF